MATDAQHVLQHLARAAGGLQGLGQDDEVEGIVGIVGEVGVGVALDHGEAVGDAVVHALLGELDAAGVDAVVLGEVVQQRAVAAADVEHAGARLAAGGRPRRGRAAALARLSPGANGPLPPFGFSGLWPAAARARAQPSRKPWAVALNSGSSMRKASWPRSVAMSTKETEAPDAFSA